MVKLFKRVPEENRMVKPFKRVQEENDWSIITDAMTMSYDEQPTQEIPTVANIQEIPTVVQKTDMFASFFFTMEEFKQGTPYKIVEYITKDLDFLDEWSMRFRFDKDFQVWILEIKRSW